MAPSFRRLSNTSTQPRSTARAKVSTLSSMSRNSRDIWSPAHGDEEVINKVSSGNVDSVRVALFALIADVRKPRHDLY